MDDRAATQPPAPRHRGWLRIAVGCLILVVALAAAAWTSRLWIAERLAPVLLARAGIGPVSLTVERLDLSGATGTDIAIGGETGQRIARIEAAYSPGGLWRGTVRQVTVEGSRLRGRLTPIGPVFDGLPATGGGDAEPAGGLPVQRLEIEQARAEIGTPAGLVTVSTTARIDTPDGMTSDITGTFALESDLGKAGGTIAASRLASGETYGRVALSDGTVTASPVDAEGIVGTVQFIALPGGATDLDANLDIASLSVAGETLRDGRLAAGFRRSSKADVSFETTLAIEDGRIGLAGTVGPTPDGALKLAASLTADIARDGLTARLHGEAEVSRDTAGRVAGRLEIGDGELRFGDKAVAGLRGSATAEGSLEDGFGGAADLRFGRFSAFGLTGNRGEISLTESTVNFSGTAALEGDGLTLTVDARGDWSGALKATVSGRFEPSKQKSALPEGVAAGGAVSFETAGQVADFTGSFQRYRDTAWRALEGVAATGWIEAALTDIALPDLLRGGAAEGKVTVSGEAGSWTAATDGLALSGVRLDRALLARLPEAVRAILSKPVRATLTPRQKGSPATLRITRRGDGAALAGSAALRVAAGDAAATIEADATAAFDGDGALLSAQAPAATMSLAKAPVGGGRVGGKLTLENLQMTPTLLRAGFALNGTADGVALAPLAPLTGSVRAEGRVTREGDTLALTLAPATALTLDRLALPDKFRSDAPITLSPEGPATLRLDLAKGLRSLAYDAVLPLPALHLEFKGGETWRKLHSAPAHLSARGTGGRHRLTLDAEQFDLPDDEWRASGVALTLDAATAPGAETTAALAIERIDHTGTPRLVVPLRLTASAKRTGDRVAFEGRLSDPPERLSVEATGKHDLASGAGAASIDLRKLTFLPTVLQPAQLFPVLGKTLREVDGDVDALAKLAWGGGGLDSSLDLMVQAKALTAAEFAVENAAAVIRFDSLFPLSTPPKQEIAIGLLDVGVPLANGRAEFQLTPDGRVHGALRELDFFGGRIESEPFTIPASFDGFTVPLRVYGVELEQLLALAQSGDLSATGTLDGDIPVVIRDARVAVRGGVLESTTGGGSIRYAPTAVGPALEGANEGTKLFLDIVKDFRYDSIRVTLDEDAFGEVAFGFKIQGRNMAVYDGVPVELNVTMDGPLRKILGQGIKAYTLPENLLKRIEAFRQKAETSDKEPPPEVTSGKKQ